MDRSRKPAAPRPASRQYVPASSCAKPLPGIQRPRGSYAERPLRQTAGVVRFRSSLEGLTDKGRELFRKYSEQFYPSDVLRSSGLEPVRCGCGRTYRLLDYGQVVPGFNWDADADAFNFHHTYCSKEHLVSQAYLGDEATIRLSFLFLCF